MIDGPCRRILPKVTGWLITIYTRLGLTPNQLTTTGSGFGFAAAYAIATDHFLVAICLWWIGRLLDGTDGIYARATMQVSAFGGYLDVLSDMAAYSVMILGFAYRFPELAAAWSVILFFYVLCITSALALGDIERQKGLGPADNRSLRLAAGLAEGGETGLAYTLFLLFPSALPMLTWIWITVLALTIVMRTILAWRVLKPLPSSSTGER
jgi:phosphatidylglycerophosphate synthase